MLGDAADLASGLIERMDWNAAVSEYEIGMFECIVESAEGSAEGAATLPSHDGQALTLAMYRSHEAAPSEVCSASVDGGVLRG
ncbi:hypothetical protein ASD86_02070 [Lysobacter sp. Root690]|nr:hypothetical protein ASD86_02070 [Lysobacter sp. Root690]